MNWRDYTYLQSGSVDQRRAFQTLKSLELFEVLQSFDPALVSTICLNLHTAESDLDIICEMTSADDFVSIIKRNYSQQEDFSMWERPNGEKVAWFQTESFPIEIFGGSQPVEQQYAWRHLNIMERILNLSPSIREQIIDHKHKGLATEEAFAKLLNLDGNPYEVLLSFEEKTDKEIARIIQRAVN